MHRLFVIIVSVVTVAAVPAPQSSPCPDGWVLAGNHTCFQFNNRYQLAQGQASLNCVNQGAALLRFASYDEMVQFSTVATQQPVDGWWTSLSDSCTRPPARQCSWTWGHTDQVVSGSLVWATEPTDNHHVENCVTMDGTGLLNDDMCDNRFGYICSYSTKDVCLGDDWTLVNGTCYYVSHLEDLAEVVSWGAAESFCGTFEPNPFFPSIDLATFTSAQLIVLQSVVTGVSPAGKRWVGMNDQMQEGQWMWSYDSNVTDTAFLPSQWHHYPDPSTGHSCGLVHSNGKMEPANCTLLRPFVCKKYIDPDMWLVTQDAGCAAPWLRGGSKCYYLNSNLTMGMPSARAFCNTMNGDLIKIGSQDEKTWLSLETVSYQLNNLWTGLRRTSDGAQTWVWADGSASDPLLYEWNKEPNDFGLGEDCAIMNTEGGFNDASCFMPARYICETDAENYQCPPFWVTNSPLGSEEEDLTCYYVSKLQDGKATWQEARSSCQQLAGVPEAHLIAIETQKEMDFLMSLIQNDTWAEYWTDLTDSVLEGSWQFSDSYMGTPPPIPWDQEPDNKGGHENCAVMLTEGRFADVSCDSNFYVACEKPAAGVTGTTVNSGAAAVLPSGLSVIVLCAIQLSFTHSIRHV